MKNARLLADRRLLVTLVLGFSSGLPFALTGATLQAWLTESHLSVSTIGLFALVGLPYTVKFLWAPLLDRYPLPFLGLRRGWGVVSLLGVMGMTTLLGMINPAEQLELFSAAAMALAFFSATQDIVVDAYRTEIVDEKLYGAGAGIYTAGYRIAFVVSGGGALVMADHMSWSLVYAAMAALNGLGLIALLVSPEPNVPRARPTLTVRESLLAPFVEFFKRGHAMEILLFVMIYKLSTLMATALTTNFLLTLGYSKTVIGSTNKVAGLIGTILGTITGGALMMRFGLERSLWVFGFVQSLVGLTFFAMPHVAGWDEGLREVGLVAVIGMDYFMMGLGVAAIMGFMMHVCSKQFTGTQLALLSSLPAVTRVILIAHAGTIVEKIGWDWFYLGTIPLALPGLLLLMHFDRWQAGADTATARFSRVDKLTVGVFLVSLIALSSDPLWRFLNVAEFGQRVIIGGALGILGVIAWGLFGPYLRRAPSPRLDDQPVKQTAR